MRLAHPAILLTILLAIGAARAQMPGMGAPSGAAPALMQPAAPETLRAELLLPEGFASCRGIEVQADSVTFGQPVEVVLWFEDEAVRTPQTPPESSAPWLLLEPWQPGKQAGSLRTVARVHALDFFQLQAGEAVGPIVPMASSRIDLSETAPVRMPRTWATRWWVLLLAAGLLALLFWGGWKLWQRRRRLSPLQQWDPAPCAWLEAAPRLRRLLQDDREAAADTHLFCDRLAGIVRRFLAGRYLVPATEMTGAEILAGLRARGYGDGSAARLTRLVEDLDNHRYDPQPPSATWCRGQATRFFAAMDQTRIVPRYVRIDPGLRQEAEQAWSWLEDPRNLAPEAPAVAGGDR